MVRRQLAHRRILITGASSGIGAALARELAGRRARLLLTARRQDRLETLARQLAANEPPLIVPGDLTSPDLRQKLLETAQRQWGGLDILINNAGIGAVGPFCQAQPERLRQVMEVNFFAPAELIRTACPLLRQGQQPLIVNVSSILGYVAVPQKSEYCASKFALHGLHDALRCELAGEGIDLLLVNPNTTRTEFFENVIEQTGRAARNPLAMPATTVARKMVRAMERQRGELTLTASGQGLIWVDRLAPRLLSRLLARWG